MIAGVADTHAAIWHLFNDPMLSAAARRFIDDAAVARQKIALSPISLAEVVYLIEKKRLPTAAYTDLGKAISDPDHVREGAPFTMEIVEAVEPVLRAPALRPAGPAESGSAACEAAPHSFDTLEVGLLART